MLPMAIATVQLLTHRMIVFGLVWLGLVSLCAVTGSPAAAPLPSPSAPTATIEPIAGRAGPGIRIVGATGDLDVAWRAAGTLEARAPVRWRVDRGRLAAATAGLVDDVVVEGRLLRVTLAPGVVATPSTAVDGTGDHRWLLVDRRAEPAPRSPPAAATAPPIGLEGESLVPLPEPAAGPSAPADREHRGQEGLVQALGTAEGAELRFVWPSGSGAAVLQRGGRVWIGLSGDPGTVEIDRAAVASALAGLVVGLREVPADKGRVLQLRLERTVGLAVHREGDTWVVALTRQPSPPPRPVALRTSPAGIGLADAAVVIAVDDEATGDRLFLAPLRDAPLGLPRPIRLPDADLLATAQGIAWRARSDRALAPTVDPDGRALLPIALGPAAADRLAAGLAAVTDPARAHADGTPGHTAGEAGQTATALARSEQVAIGGSGASARPGGESAPSGHGQDEPTDRAGSSSDGRGHGVPAAATDPSMPAAPDARTLAVLNARGIGLASLDDASLAELRRIGQRLAALAAASREPEQRSRARVAWARTLIGAHRSAEALGLLELERNDDDATALASVAALLADLAPTDAAALLDGARDPDPEIGLWRLLLPRDDGDAPTAWPSPDDLVPVLERYPLALRFEAGRRLAERAIEDGRGEIALKLRDALERAPLSARQKAVTAWLAGTVLGREGDLAAAREQLGIAARNGDPSIRAAAETELVRAEREAGTLDAAEAAKRLTAARPQWRGLPNEGQLLVRLGDEAERAGRPIEALAAWRDALGKGLAAGPSRRLSQRLQATFVASLETLTARARAEPAAALEAVALLDRFPELVPPGQPGTELRSAVARSLVPAGFPKLALRLAEPLGRATPVVGALERASWHLAAGEPERAIAVLEGAADPAAPADRAQVAARRARARLLLDDPTAALEELAGLERTDPATEAVRREALWRLEDRSGFVAASDPTGTPPAGGLDRLRLATIAFASGDDQRARDLLATPPGDEPVDPALAALREGLAMPVPGAGTVRELLPASDAAQSRARAISASGPATSASGSTADPAPDRG